PFRTALTAPRPARPRSSSPRGRGRAAPRRSARRRRRRTVRTPPQLYAAAAGRGLSIGIRACGRAGRRALPALGSPRGEGAAQQLSKGAWVTSGTYDVVVVGSGSAGSVIARRLVDAGVRVCLI